MKPVWALILLMTLAAAGTARGLVRNLLGAEEYQLSDWAISYAAGFVRRGAGGEILAATGLPPHVAAFGLAALLNALALAAVWKLARPAVADARVWLALASPAFLTGPAVIARVPGHKDVLLLALLGWAFLLRRGLSERGRFALALAAFWGVAGALLLHEGLLAFAPWFLVLLAGLRIDARRAALLALPVAAGLGVVAASLLHPATPEQAAAICADFLARLGPAAEGVDCLTRGAIRHLALGAEAARALVAERALPELPMLPLALVLIGGPPVIVARALGLPAALERGDRILVLVAVALAAAMTAALMSVALDWGRFLWLHAQLATICLLALAAETGRFAPVPRPRPWIAAALVWGLTWHPVKYPPPLVGAFPEGLPLLAVALALLLRPRAGQSRAASRAP